MPVLSVLRQGLPPAAKASGGSAGGYGGREPQKANNPPLWIVFKWGAAGRQHVWRSAIDTQTARQSVMEREESDGRNRIGPGNVTSAESI